MENVEKRLRKVLIEYGIDQSKISENSDYYFDLNLDMLDLMCLAKNIEKEFMIKIPDNEVLRMERVSDTRYFLKQRSSVIVMNSTYVQ